MKLHELIQSKGLKKKKARLGRGDASKYGNYSGKGHKGQKARSGGGVRPQFEGGQTTLFMRLPKRRGFKRFHKLITTYAPVNVASLEADERIKAGDTVTKDLLVEYGYVGVNDVVKVLGKGDITKKITLQGVDAASKSAQQKIEAAGGSLELAS